MATFQISLTAPSNRTKGSWWHSTENLLLQQSCLRRTVVGHLFAHTHFQSICISVPSSSFSNGNSSAVVLMCGSLELLQSYPTICVSLGLCNCAVSKNQWSLIVGFSICPYMLRHLNVCKHSQWARCWLLHFRDLRQVDHLEPELSASAQCIVLHFKCQLYLEKVKNAFMKFMSVPLSLFHF